VCFKCGLVGHYAKDCHQVAARSQGSLASNNQTRQRAKTKVYSFAPGNVKVDANAIDIVIGTIPLFGSVVCVLFDLGLPTPLFRLHL